MTQAGFKCSTKCPYKREVKGYLTEKKVVWPLKQDAMLLSLKMEEGTINQGDLEAKKGKERIFPSLTP